MKQTHISSQLVFTHEKEHRSVEVKRIIMVNNHTEKTQQQMHSNI